MTRFIFCSGAFRSFYEAFAVGITTQRTHRMNVRVIVITTARVNAVE